MREARLALSRCQSARRLPRLQGLRVRKGERVREGTRAHAQCGGGGRRPSRGAEVRAEGPGRDRGAGRGRALRRPEAEGGPGAGTAGPYSREAAVRSLLRGPAAAGAVAPGPQRPR